MTGADHPEGFEVPLHISLVEPILLAGVPRVIAIANGTLAAAIGLGLQQWAAGLVLWAAGHTAALLACRRDPEIARVLSRHLAKRGYWSC